MKLDQKEEETILDSEIDEFDIEQITEKFRKWMISNRDRFLVDFENPKGKLKQDENTVEQSKTDCLTVKVNFAIHIEENILVLGKMGKEMV